MLQGGKLPSMSGAAEWVRNDLGVVSVQVQSRSAALELWALCVSDHDPGLLQRHCCARDGRVDGIGAALPPNIIFKTI
jgi:hypothetical protein